MTRTSALVAAAMLFSSTGLAQSPSRPSTTSFLQRTATAGPWWGMYSCGYNAAPVRDITNPGPPDPQVLGVVHGILRAEGLLQLGQTLDQVGIKFMAADLDAGIPAIARFNQVLLTRSIYYDRSVHEQLKSPITTRNLKGIFAHELAHHLLGHTFETGGAPDDELEADFYSGYHLRHAGYADTEVRDFVLGTAIPGEDVKYPSPEKRAESASLGWRVADELLHRAQARPLGEQLAQDPLTEVGAAPLDAPVPTSWAGFIEIGSPAVAYFAIANDHRIFRLSDSGPPEPAGSRRTPRDPRYAWSWETADGILHVTRSGDVLAGMPSGPPVKVGRIVATKPAT